MKFSLKTISQISLIFCGIVALYITLDYFQQYIIPLVIAILLNFFIVDFLKKSFKQKIISSSIFLWVIALFLWVIYFFIPWSEITKSLYSEILQVEKILNSDAISQHISFEQVSIFIKNILSSALTSISSLFSLLVLVFLFLLFLIPSYKGWIEGLQKIFFPNNKQWFTNVLSEIELWVKSYLGVTTFVSLITALSSWAIFFFFWVTPIFLLIILTFLLNFIPTIGSIVAVLIAVLVFVFQNEPGAESIIFFVVLLTSLQFYIWNVLFPKLAWKKINISPFLVIISLFFWGTLWGIVWMIISIPLTYSIKVMIEKISKSNSN